MNHIAAIHVLKSQCKLSDDDYRALLMQLTGKDSCKAMHATQLTQVRTHLDNLAVRLLGGPLKPFDKNAFQVMKIKALWLDLAALGPLKDPSQTGLRLFIKSQSANGVEDAAFLTPAERSKVIEALKSWARRVKAAAAK